MDVVLVGAGRVGTAVAILLQRAGHEVVGVVSRTPQSSSRASERLGTEVFEARALPAAELVLVGVADRAVEEIATEIAPRVEPGSLVCHFAGSLGTSPLKAVVDRGARGCAVHPVQACPSVDAAIERLPGSVWGVTSTDAASERQIGSMIESDLGGRPVSVPEDKRPIWHAAAVMTSNGIAALLATGEDLLEAIGIENPTGVLGPLAAGTIQNAREGGGGAATLTGPVVRGEKETLERHLGALAELPEQHRDRYVEVAALIVRVAVGSGRLDETAAARILRSLET